MGLTSLNWKEVYRDVSRQNTRSNKSVERDRPKALVIAYCFPPYADTGANVLAKRIDRCGEVIDVISVRMTPVRRKDPGTYSIVAPYIRRHVVLPLPPSFGNWRSISLFAVSAALAATLLNRVRKYDTLYSRSMWSASHVAAALVKLKLPKLRWIAEFSDPMRLGIDGRERPGGPATGLIASRLKRAIEAEVKGGYELGSHFHLTEVATLVLADQIVFTNENQRAVMLAGYPERIQKQVLRKSVVCAHPKPSVRIKSMAGDGFVPIKGKINLAYFGSFYGNRGIDSLMEAFASLGRDQKKRFALHIFTDSRMNLAKYVQTDGDRVDLIVHKSLPYLEFLGALEDFDVLIVTDTESIQSGFSANPFLPSKIADYSSTATPVWGIVEPSSPLAMQTLTYRSYIGDLVSYSTVLQAILRDLDTAG